MFYKKPKYAKQRIIQVMMIFIIPFIIFLISYNIYTLKVLNDTLIQSGVNNLNIYYNPIENELNHAENSMVKVMANDASFQQMLYSSKYSDVFVYSQNVINNLNQALYFDKAITCTIVYNSKQDVIREKYTGNYTFSEKEQIRYMLRNKIENKQIENNRWVIEKVNDKFYLCRILNKRDNYLMVLYDFNKIDKPQDYPSNVKNAFLFFANDSMQAMTSQDEIEEKGIVLEGRKEQEHFITGDNQKYLVVQKKMKYDNSRILYAVPYYNFMQSMSKVPFFFLIASVFVLFLLILSFKLLDVYFLSPMKKSVNTMKEIKEGNLDAKMSYSNIMEFNTLAETFNEMIEEIKVLNITRYQNEIEIQQAKLQYLQIQIRPHFYINCLKNLYGLVGEKKYLQMEETILAMSAHLRYMFKDMFKMVTVDEEMQSIKNYVLLQQIMSLCKVSCNIEVNPCLEKYFIPPLSILTFVENSIKHGNQGNKQLIIQIKVGLLDSPDEKYINITILDNGPGFPQKSLDELNKQKDFTYKTSQIGIENVKHRFSLIYQDKCTFLFSNINGSGASIQIFIPVDESDLNTMNEE